MKTLGFQPLPELEEQNDSKYRDKFLEACDEIDELKRENERLHKALLKMVLKLD